ncbi:MAG: MFS transporter [Candidatus Caldarchaeum sp.]
MRRDTNPLWPGALLVGASMAVMMQMAPLQAVLLKASYTEVGLLMGFARNLLYVILSPLTAVILSRINWNIPLPLSAVLMSVSLLVMWSAGDLVAVLAAQLVMGVSMFYFFPCGESIISNSFTGADRFRAFSILLSAVSGGFLLGSLLAGVIAYLAGLKVLFASAAFIALVGAVFLSKVRVVNNMETRLGGSNLRTIARPLLFSTPYFLMLASSYSVLPGFLVLNGMTELDVGILFFSLMLSRVTVSYLLSKIKLELVEMLLPASSFMLGFSFIISSFYTSSFPAYLMLLVLIGSVVSMAYVTTLYLVSTKTKTQDVFYIGLFETLIGLTFLAGPPVAGFLTDVYGLPSLLQAFAAASIAAGLVNLRIKP